MAQRKALNRLLRLRSMEEEQKRLELESAVGVRNRAAAELAAAVASRARGRRGVVMGIAQGDSVARTGAVIEMELASRWRTRVEPRLEVAEVEVEIRRQEFLDRRTGRRQVETLVGRERTAMLEEAGRRAQQILDDWYGRKTARLAPGPENEL